MVEEISEQRGDCKHSNINTFSNGDRTPVVSHRVSFPIPSQADCLDSKKRKGYYLMASMEDILLAEKIAQDEHEIFKSMRFSRVASGAGKFAADIFGCSINDVGSQARAHVRRLEEMKEKEKIVNEIMKTHKEDSLKKQLQIQNLQNEMEQMKAENDKLSEKVKELQETAQRESSEKEQLLQKHQSHLNEFDRGVQNHLCEFNRGLQELLRAAQIQKLNKKESERKNALAECPAEVGEVVEEMLKAWSGAHERDLPENELQIQKLQEEPEEMQMDVTKLSEGNKSLRETTRIEGSVEKKRPHHTDEQKRLARLRVLQQMESGDIIKLNDEETPEEMGTRTPSTAEWRWGARARNSRLADDHRHESLLAVKDGALTEVVDIICSLDANDKE